MDYRWYDPSMDIVPRRRMSNGRKVETTREADKDNDAPVDNDPQDAEAAGGEMSETMPDVQIQQPLSE